MYVSIVQAEMVCVLLIPTQTHVPVCTHMHRTTTFGISSWSVISDLQNVPRWVSVLGRKEVMEGTNRQTPRPLSTSEGSQAARDTDSADSQWEAGGSLAHPSLPARRDCKPGLHLPGVWVGRYCRQVQESRQRPHLQHAARTCCSFCHHAQEVSSVVVLSSHMTFNQSCSSMSHMTTNFAHKIYAVHEVNSVLDTYLQWVFHRQLLIETCTYRTE